MFFRGLLGGSKEQPSASSSEDSRVFSVSGLFPYWFVEKDENVFFAAPLSFSDGKPSFYLLPC